MDQDDSSLIGEWAASLWDTITSPVIGVVEGIQASPSPSQEDLDNNLLNIARQGSADQIKQLITNGADANAHVHFAHPFNQGEVLWDTPLSCAAQSNTIEVVKLLVSAGADVNTIPSNRLSPLVLASIRHDPEGLEIATFLLNKGADLDYLRSINFAITKDMHGLLQNHDDYLYEIAVYITQEIVSDKKFGCSKKMQRDITNFNEKNMVLRVIMPLSSEDNLPTIGDTLISQYDAEKVINNIRNNIKNNDRINLLIPKAAEHGFKITTLDKDTSRVTSLDRDTSALILAYLPAEDVMPTVIAFAEKPSALSQPEEAIVPALFNNNWFMKELWSIGTYIYNNWIRWS